MEINVWIVRKCREIPEWEIELYNAIGGIWIPLFVEILSGVLKAKVKPRTFLTLHAKNS